MPAVDGSAFTEGLGAAAAAEELARRLAAAGAVSCVGLLPDSTAAALTASADRWESAGAFVRLPSALERGYLGRDLPAKTLALDASAATGFLEDPAVLLLERSLTALVDALRLPVLAATGWGLASRTATLLARPLLGAEEDVFEAPDLANEDAAGFLLLARRSRIAVLVNAGPGAATLTLSPTVSGRRPWDADAEGCSVIEMQAGGAVLVAVERFRWTLRPRGRTLFCSTFALSPPPQYAINGIVGDPWELAGCSAGSAPPSGRDMPAVVSLATRYAFGADEPWKLFVGFAKAGFDTQTRHPYTRWDVDMYYEPDGDPMMGKSYTCHGGFFEGVDLFDCKFFDISPMEARGMDPTQRHVLEVAFLALKNAGYSKQGLISRPSNIAAFVGLDKNEWRDIPKDQCGGFGASNSANAITANRFNYCLNLRGASMTIDTACSSSLVAQHTAKLYLLNKHFDPCECAIVCGVNLSVSPLSYLGCCAAGMHSHAGRCFTYNATADGYARGESVGATATKLRPWDPEVGDFAMLAGSHANQDGRSASLTAPSGPAQERCNKAVMKELGLKPAEIDTTECHGTGTALGDPIEIGAYRKVMSAIAREEPVVITTSKSNLGHCEGSAGIGGFLKVVLMCMYGEGTPNCHFSILNSHLDMEGFPAIITTEGVTFRADASYNGVLSFGFGGTNACATVWGTNCMTSRAVASKDAYDLAYRRVLSLHAQPVAMPSLDWEDWEMDFPPRNPRPDDVWDVEFDDAGGALFSRRSRTIPELSAGACLSGSFNDWGCLELEVEHGAPGLLSACVTIGHSGFEDFQVLSGAVAFPSCGAGEPTRALSWVPARSAGASGPCLQPSAARLCAGAAPSDGAWRIAGTEGDQYLVEFHLLQPRDVAGSEESGSTSGDSDGEGRCRDDISASVSWAVCEAGE